MLENVCDGFTVPEKVRSFEKVLDTEREPEAVGESVDVCRTGVAVGVRLGDDVGDDVWDSEEVRRQSVNVPVSVSSAVSVTDGVLDVELAPAQATTTTRHQTAKPKFAICITPQR